METSLRFTLLFSRFLAGPPTAKKKGKASLSRRKKQYEAKALYSVDNFSFKLDFMVGF